MVTTAGRIDDRIKSQIEIVQVADDGNEVFVWVKNVGATRIGPVEQSDVFFGKEGNFSRITYSEAGSPEPCWNYIIENDTEWAPTATLKVTIHLAEAPPSGTCFVKIVIPNGISDEHQFST